MLKGVYSIQHYKNECGSAGKTYTKSDLSDWSSVMV